MTFVLVAGISAQERAAARCVHSPHFFYSDYCDCGVRLPCLTRRLLDALDKAEHEAELLHWQASAQLERAEAAEAREQALRAALAVLRDRMVAGVNPLTGDPNFYNSPGPLWIKAMNDLLGVTSDYNG